VRFCSRLKPLEHRLSLAASLSALHSALFRQLMVEVYSISAGFSVYSKNTFIRL